RRGRAGAGRRRRWRAECGVATEHRPMQVPQLRTRLDAELLDQRRARPVVHGHRPGNVAEARDALRDGDAAAAAAGFDAALTLWDGPMLAGLPRGPVLAARCAAVEDDRLTAVEQLAEARLSRAAPGDAAALLREHLSAHPLRERAVLLLMRALYRLGDVAGAMAVYDRARTALVEQLGIEPGTELRDLHRAMLRRDPELGAPPPPMTSSSPATAAGTGATGPASAVPGQLPLDVSGFTGRDAELAVLDRLLDRGEPHRTATVVAVIAGTAGVGKTAVAVHWAHRVRGRFPDGQLYVNLRAFDPAGTPTSPDEAVRGFLDALDVPARRIPTDLAGQAALYRSLLADRRVLILLDNARDAQQVRPLLPGAPGCLVLITSRNQLTSLVAAEGAHPVPLDLLTASAARQLLSRRLGASRTAAEPEAVDEIIERCAGLPLALAVVAGRAATQPRLPLAALAGELRDAQSRLDALHGGDHAADVRTVFSWSYRTLGARAARLFRLLGLHPGPEVGIPAAARLAGLPADDVRPLLAELTRAHLVVEHAAGRFTCHDLLRAYAAELARLVDPDRERRAALHRIIDHYLGADPRRDRAVAPLVAGSRQEEAVP
ncbi:MAG TPA: BTAD domain-containing putative transcriptional regulator, partial [Pilimelia sp.]|nr:BTAD domain-containing putative transcriptional regulator [Pilimelia sp.]